MSKAESFPDMADLDAQAWVGRTEEKWGKVTPVLAGMLDAAVAHPLSAKRDLRCGAHLPCLWHWVAFPEFVPLAELARDGHPALGGFLPPLPYERRMWAGGSLTWHGGLRIGEALNRRSEILAVTEKHGSTGSMVFVKVGHVIEGENGGFIEEKQDIVYLHIPDEFRPPKPIPVPDATDFDETVPMNEARLFRYSAATFNAHRIHYDLPYAREVEKYPNLVVHGPMQATMLIEACKRHTGAPAKTFRFKGVHPMFHDSDLRLVGRMEDNGKAMELATAAAAGHLGMQARMEWL